MLKQLLKYECKASGRWFGLCYAGILLAAILLRLMMEVSPSSYWGEANAVGFVPQMLANLSALLYSVMVGAVLVLTFVAILQRFYKNLLGGEGYMMHTLPVPAWQHILSKLIAAMLWIFLSAIVLILSVMILTLTTDILSAMLKELPELSSFFMQTFGIHGWLLMVEVFVLFVISMAETILQIYAAIMIGQLANKHRVLLAVGAYFGMSLALNVIATVAGNVANLLGQNLLSNTIDAFFTGGGYPALIHGGLLISMVWLAVLCVVFFAVTEYLMRRNLNLE